MSSIINASVASNGIVSTADASGILKVQSNGVTTNALAWINFNGNSGGTTRASYNVSSFVRNSAGYYTINFTNTLTDSNYSITGTAGSGNAFGSYALVNRGAGTSTTTGSVSINTFITQTASVSDVDTVCVAIFGN